MSPPPPATASRILVTGASGFVGAALTQSLLAAGHAVVATGRSRSPAAGGPGLAWRAADIRSDPLEPLLDGVDAVVHAAGIAHSEAPEALHRAVTVDGTRRLVEAMQRGGARRLVFISSIRAQVGGFCGAIVLDADAPAPEDAYGRAKRDAEAIVAASGLAATILRPVLVADVGARGNLAMLLKLAASPLPLPFAALRARRSLVSRASLVDAVRFALGNPATAGGCFAVADAEPLAVGEIVAVLRGALGRRPGLVAVPPSLLRAGLRLAGRGADFDRLGRPLVVAADGLRRLGWTAPEPARAALIRMAQSAS